MIPGETRSRLHQATRAERDVLLARVASAVGALPDVRVVYAFGSFAGDGPFRDIDLGVVFEREPGWQAPAQVAVAVGAVVDPEIPIDVVTLNDADTFFKELVAEKGRVVFERHPGDALEYAVMARSEAIDLREWQRIHGLRR